MTVTVRYFAAACAAATVEQERIAAPIPATVADILDRCIESRGTELAAVLANCSFLLDEVAVHDRSTLVAPGQAIDVLPPFAGG
jgi:molybdopterin synthase sulfur carrier subunit